jgi:hypothetical protein
MRYFCPVQLNKMKSLRLILLVVFSSWVFHVASAQETHVCHADSGCHALIISHPFSLSPDTTRIDTNISRFYQPAVFASAPFFPAVTGTSGHPGLDLRKTFRLTADDYLYHNPYEFYQLNPDNLQVIRSETPFSEWFYQMGGNREQVFRATHAQDAGKNFNFGLDLKFVNSKGDYQHEHARAYCLGIYAQFRDPVRPLQSDLLIFVNGAVTEENGGISDPSYFVDTNKINRQLVPVWLTTAQNSHRSTEVIWRNRWYPGQRVVSSITPDSNEVAQPPEKQSARKIHHHVSLDLKMKRSWFTYRDTDPFNPWYSLTRYDTIVTFDSVANQRFTADLAYHLLAWKRVGVKSGVRINAYRYYDTLNPGGAGFSFSPYTDWSVRLFSGIFLQADASVLYDHAFGIAHSVNTSLKWQVFKRVQLMVQLDDWTNFPFRQDIMYASNHFIWNNPMKNQHFTRFTPSIAVQGKIPVDISAVVTRIDRLIYYNSSALPNQYLGQVMLYQLIGKARGSIGRLNVDGKIALQRSSEAEILRIPQLLAEVMAGYRFSMFAGKITAIGGVVVHGRTKAYLDQYMPVTRVFYHTNQAPVQDYVWADPFLTFLLKKTRFMLKYEHASAWLAGFGQYALPGYPMQDPTIRFAVSWRFMD